MMNVLNAGFPQGKGKGGKEPFKFTQATEECATLKTMMENGEITPSTCPADARQSREEFKKMPVDSNKFRVQFNKLKDISGLKTREGMLASTCATSAASCCE